MIAGVTSRIRLAAFLLVIPAALIAARLVTSEPQTIEKATAMNGKVVLVTGSTDGLGREVARRVAAQGARVIVHGRNKERGAAVVDEIAREGKGTARFYAADFGSLDQVRTFADAVRRDYPRLDVLVNNAGIWLRERRLSADGHEMQFAVNYLAGFLLTRSLLPLLEQSAPSRIVNVASGSQSAIDFTDVMLERPGRAEQGYAQSKLAQVMFTFALAAELQNKGVTVRTLHPATMMNTTMVRESGLPSQSTVDEGANAVMNLITSPDVTSGQFYNGLSVGRANRQAYDADARARLRELSLQLTSRHARP